MKAKDVRKGTVLLHNGNPCKVMEYRHITPGKGNAKCWIKMRNLKSGIQTETSVGSVEDLDVAEIFTFKATYLYKDNDGYNFMSVDSYEQLNLSAEVLGDAVYYLQEEMQVDITTFDEEPIGVNLPDKVILEVMETEPELKGATVTSSGKPAKTNTGLTVTVPGFVKEGDRIIVNTLEGAYVSRAD